MYPQVFGKYVLERELARGGMARVVLATLRGARGFEKRLVVKQIRDDLACDDEFVRRFVEEAKTTVALAHPNIVPVYELGVELGTYFLAMEWVDGASVAELLRALSGSEPTPARLTPEEGAYVGVEVCRALDYAHRRMNVVHGDVTPRNVMVDEEGQIKVIDFGIAAPVAVAPSGHGVFGSPGHMPPEQMAGLELTPAADVFAVAVLLMELWSGRPPFRRRTTDEIEAAMRAPHPRPSAADIRLVPLDDVMSAAMALEPGARPRQAEDLGRALRKFLVGVDVGDVARQLGERVRAARANPLPPAAPLPVLARPPSRPTATQVGTKTFAARPEVQAAGSPLPDQPSTRRIPSIAPDAPDAEPPSPPRVRATAHHIVDGRPEMPARRPGWTFVLGGGALATLAFVLGRGASSAPAPASPRSVGGEPAGIPSLTPAASAVSFVEPSAAPGGSTRVVAASDLPASPPSSPFEPNSATAPTARGAQLVLVGRGTLVSVDGVAHGPAPARFTVEAGAHTVVFAFPATGETTTTSLVVRPGERATLRADFTGANPAVLVEHASDTADASVGRPRGAW